MRCWECKVKIRKFYYLLGGYGYCPSCALEFMVDLSAFKVKLKKGGK